MPLRKNLLKVFQALVRQIMKLSKAITKGLMSWLLRNFLVLMGGRRSRLATAGFVLPTVVMVMLVVVLLTTAIMIRSFDRTRNASNVRVNQAVLNAATPAIERAKAKIEDLMGDPNLAKPPLEADINNFLTKTNNNNNKYTLGDETALLLRYNFTGANNGANPPLKQDPTIKTAWRFGVDTDNNGKFDSFTLYGIYFRSPESDTARARVPIEARTPPQDLYNASGACPGANRLPGADWYTLRGQLKKSFFVFVATVPVTQQNINDEGLQGYEPYKGNKGFSGLEYQQDRSLIPGPNNAIQTKDDLDISKATDVRVNGRLVTNGNLLVGGDAPDKVYFYQVSSPNSCYYEAEYSKIIVGGNVANGGIEESVNKGGVEVHRFQGKGVLPDGRNNTSEGISGTNKTTTADGGSTVGYNADAYNKRIQLLVNAGVKVWNTSGLSSMPKEVRESFRDKYNNTGGDVEKQAVLQTFFEDRVRRVPYAEVAEDSSDALGSYTEDNIFSGGTIKAPDAWMKIDSSDTKVTLNISGNRMYLLATEPNKQKQTQKEDNLGDRIKVGNGLPAKWAKYDAGGNFKEYSTNSTDTQEVGSGVVWNDTNGSPLSGFPRTRQSQIQSLFFADASRGGNWEYKAVIPPTPSRPTTGGARIITGAGIYRNNSSTSTKLSDPSFMPPPLKLDFSTDSTPPTPVIPTSPTLAGSAGAPYTLVWPDSMPMQGGIDDSTTTTVNESIAPPDFRMRATAVYHYAADPVDSNPHVAQTPIACVSSYYDPTNAATARNPATDALGHTLPDVSGDLTQPPRSPNLQWLALFQWQVIFGGQINHLIGYSCFWICTTCISIHRFNLSGIQKGHFPNCAMRNL